MRARILSAAALMFAAQANAQFSISSFTVDGGGGMSSGGSFSVTGTVGQAEASNPSTGTTFSLTGGFWGPETAGFGTWAAMNIPAGKDRSFTGDADGDGISNGLQYALGNGVKGRMLRPKVFEAPTEPVPGDVILTLEGSFTMLGGNWFDLVYWESGESHIVTSELRLEDGEIRDFFMGSKFFYRWVVRQN